MDGAVLVAFGGALAEAVVGVGDAVGRGGGIGVEFSRETTEGVDVTCCLVASYGIFDRHGGDLPGGVVRVENRDVAVGCGGGNGGGGEVGNRFRRSSHHISLLTLYRHCQRCDFASLKDIFFLLTPPDSRYSAIFLA